MKAILDKISEIESVLNYNAANDFKDLEDYELDKPVTIENNIIVKKIEQFKHLVRMIVTVPPKASFNSHIHTYLECIKVLSGTLKDDSKQITATYDNTIIYSRGEPHKPYNPSTSQDCILLIDFYK